MRTLLIFPRMPDEVAVYGEWWVTSAIRRAIGLGKSNTMPPMSLLAIAAVTPTDVDIRIVDERFDEVDYDEPVDVVGITVTTSVAPRAYSIADEFHRRGVPVVLGGIHPTVLPDEAIQHADAVVLGEGDLTWPDLLTDVRAKRLQRFYRAERPAPLDDLPPLPRDLVQVERYFTPKTIVATRGCANACVFCSAGSAVGRRFRTRAVESVVAELQSLPGKLAFFADDNLGYDVDYAKALFRALIPLKIRWIGEISLPAVEDQELVELAAESGCIGLGLGFESISPETIALIGKKRTNDPARYRSLIQRMHRCGLAVLGFFLLGFDTDTKQTFAELGDFINDSGVDIPSVNTLTPYPGTVVARQLEKAGRIVHRDWERYGINGSFAYRPLQMSAEEMRDEYLELCAKVYSWRAIASRLWRSRLLSPGVPYTLHLNAQRRRTLPGERALLLADSASAPTPPEPAETA